MGCWSSCCSATNLFGCGSLDCDWCPCCFTLGLENCLWAEQSVCQRIVHGTYVSFRCLAALAHHDEWRQFNWKFSKPKLLNMPRESESTIHVLSTAYQIMTMAYCSLFHFKYPNVYIVVWLPYGYLPFLSSVLCCETEVSCLLLFTFSLCSSLSVPSIAMLG